MKVSNKSIDLGLVKRLKAGDYRAFDLLVLKYQSRLTSTAFKYVKDLQIAEDIVQESLIKSFKSINLFREDSSFYTWIYRITVNTSKNYLISKKRKDELLQTDISKDGTFEIEAFHKDTPEEILNASELQDTIMKSLNSLGEETKTALTLREFEGLSYEQIAEVVKCPVGTVRSRIFRGRELIDAAIKEFKSKSASNQTKVAK
mgnify:FL=1|tara:strand:+ start:240 stop:848 length:609 start_codon:yes stop_codon:yes gene_type:complete